MTSAPVVRTLEQRLRPTTRQFDVIVEKDSAGYSVTSMPALPGCHTQAKSLDELMEAFMRRSLCASNSQGAPTEDLDFVGVQLVTVDA